MNEYFLKADYRFDINYNKLLAKLYDDQLSTSSWNPSSDTSSVLSPSISLYGCRFLFIKTRKKEQKLNLIKSF